MGLLALPQLFGAAPCDDFEPEALAFFAEPELGEPLGEILVDQMWKRGDGGCEGLEVNVHWRDESRVRPLTTEEFAYERPGAVVIEPRGDWFKILLADRIAWVKPAPGHRFHSLSDLYQEQATYLALAWDGRLCAKPGQYRQCRLTSVAPESAPAVEVLDTQVVDGKRWFKIGFLARGNCDEGDEVIPRSEGWVPAYGKEEKPTIWFYSRGC